MHVDVAVTMVEDEINRTITEHLIGDLAVADVDVLRLGHLHVVSIAQDSAQTIWQSQRSLLDGSMARVVSRYS